MGLITKELLIEGNLSQKRMSVFFDSGSFYSLVRRDVAQSIADSIDCRQRSS